MRKQQGITFMEVLVVLALSSIFLTLWTQYFARMYALHMRSLQQLQQEALLEDLLTRMQQALRFVPHQPIKTQEGPMWCLIFQTSQSTAKPFQGFRFDSEKNIISMGRWSDQPKNCTQSARWWTLHRAADIHVLHMDAEVSKEEIVLTVTTQNRVAPNKQVTRTRHIFLHNAH